MLKVHPSFTIIISLLLVAGLFFVFYIRESPKILINPKNNSISSAHQVVIDGIYIDVEIADTPAEQEQGLSGRQNLAENTGMLFVFDHPSLYSFWMKDMNFPLDFIWIDQSWKIIDITKNVSPDTYPQTFQPQQPAQYIIELNANWTTSHNIKIGDKILLYGY